MKHSPGPWWADRVRGGANTVAFKVRSANGLVATGRSFVEGHSSGPEHEANAYLIRAAPALFREPDAIAAALEAGETVVIEPGSVKAAAITAALARVECESEEEETP
ncbi:MAG: hypothetical protein L0Z62_08045 [Gemmataceae bacterium]|nr:hypothetical protein [Gemmataceae bacterium]